MWTGLAIPEGSYPAASSECSRLGRDPHGGHPPAGGLVALARGRRSRTLGERRAAQELDDRVLRGLEGVARGAQVKQPHPHARAARQLVTRGDVTLEPP